MSTSLLQWSAGYTANWHDVVSYDDDEDATVLFTMPAGAYTLSVLQKYFIGVIDDVRIYDYALSHAEVAWLSGMTLPFDEPF